MAASFAGSAPVPSQRTGAFAGALHGEAWIPSRWRDNLENGQGGSGSGAAGEGEGGRDGAEAIARRLSSMRCTSAGRLPDGFLERVREAAQN